VKPGEERTSLRLAVTSLKDVQVRDASATGDGSYTMEGYAAVYEQETTLFDIPGYLRVDEELARGALTGVIGRANDGGELVHLNHGHDMKTAVAATNVDGIGSLELGDDFHGMRFFARVDPEDPDAQRLAVKMRRGVVRQASFAFDIGDEEIVDQRELDDGTLVLKYRINEVSHLYDVCACAQGAYPQTESYLRSLAAASLRVPDLGALNGRADLLAGLAGRSPLEGRAPVAAALAAGGERTSTESALALHKAQVDANHRTLRRSNQP
jgi:HK97 family phage prohead protease